MCPICNSKLWKFIGWFAQDVWWWCDNCKKDVTEEVEKAEKK